MKRAMILGLLAMSLVSDAPGLARSSASDAWITTKAKMTLLTTEGVGGTDIHVDTTDGRVTLQDDLRIRENRADAADGTSAARASR